MLNTKVLDFLWKEAGSFSHSQNVNIVAAGSITCKVLNENVWNIKALSLSLKWPSLTISELFFLLLFLYHLFSLFSLLINRHLHCPNFFFFFFIMNWGASQNYCLQLSKLYLTQNDPLSMCRSLLLFELYIGWCFNMILISVSHKCKVKTWLF